MSENQLYTLYQQVVAGGTNYNDYQEIVGVVRKIVALLPEFSVNGGRAIENYSQKELEYIIKEFIKKVQKLQINEANKINTEIVNQDGQKQPYRESIQSIQQKQQQQANWNQYAQQYYYLHKNDMKDIPMILGQGQPSLQNVQKIYSAFVALGIYEDIIFNSSKSRFEYIHEPGKSGREARKLTLPLFKKIIMAKLDRKYLNSKDVNLRAELDEIELKLTNKTKLHPLIKNTDEYKFFIKMLQLSQLQKKYSKLNRYMKRSINQKQKPPLKELSNKIFNKFKQFNNRNNTLPSNQKYNSNIESDLIQQFDAKYNAQFDPFLKTNIKYGDVQVLENLNKVKEKSQQENQAKLSRQLLNDLHYIPQAENIDRDIIQTAHYRDKKGGYIKDWIGNVTNRQVQQMQLNRFTPQGAVQMSGGQTVVSQGGVQQTPAQAATGQTMTPTPTALPPDLQQAVQQDIIVGAVQVQQQKPGNLRKQKLTPVVVQPPQTRILTPAQVQKQQMAIVKQQQQQEQRGYLQSIGDYLYSGGAALYEGAANILDMGIDAQADTIAKQQTVNYFKMQGLNPVDEQNQELYDKTYKFIKKQVKQDIKNQGISEVLKFAYNTYMGGQTQQKYKALQ